MSKSQKDQKNNTASNDQKKTTAYKRQKNTTAPNSQTNTTASDDQINTSASNDPKKASADIGDLLNISELSLLNIDLRTSREIDADVIYSNANLERSSKPDISEFPNLAELRERATRRARGKSVILGCYSGFDLVYCMVRFVVFLGSITIPYTTYWKKHKWNETLCAINNQSDEPKHIFEDEDAEKWIGLMTWGIYFISNLILIVGVLQLSLKLCYIYVTLKTLSLILNFLALIIFAYECYTYRIVIEVTIFLVVHAPLQIFGFKHCGRFIRSLRIAKRGLAALRSRGLGGTTVLYRGSASSSNSRSRSPRNRTEANSKVPSNTSPSPTPTAKRWYTN